MSCGLDLGHVTKINLKKKFEPKKNSLNVPCGSFPVGHVY